MIQPLFGPYGGAALAQPEQILALGGNAAWFHMFDPAAFEACARHGLAACVEVKTFRADFDKRPELCPIGVDGKPIRYGALVQGVCLSQRAFLEETEAALAAGVRAYQPAGIWLDYLTYAGWFEVPDPDLQESCFCRDCVAEFCEATGVDVTAPGEILARHAGTWMAHKCRRIAGFAARYAEIIRAQLPGCVIGAYMCPWAPDEFDGALTRIFAQDYSLLAPSIDIFTPLIYGTKSGRPASWGREFLEASPAFVPPARPVQLIMDALDGPHSLHEVGRSRVPSYGLQLFGGTRMYEDAELASAFRSAVEDIRAALG
jgi:hypothetical protein